MSVWKRNYRKGAIMNCSWLQTALRYWPYIRTEFSEKKLLENKEMVFKNGVKNKQVAAYNGARTETVPWYPDKKMRAMVFNLFN